jgi:UDP-galactopyranose mutase
MYDYLIVGAGLFGAVCAHELARAGKKSLVIDRRSHIGGNIYTEEIEGIQVHKYGAHIFHTPDKRTWDYISQFAEFNQYRHTVLANYKRQIYNLPFNMNTFNRMWGVVTPEEAEDKIYLQRNDINEPDNLEEQAISLVGIDIYSKLVKEYTEKQWGRACIDLPAWIIRRLPVRYTYNNDYFADRYQGIPVGGYTRIIDRLLSFSDVELNINFIKYRNELTVLANHIIYTGSIDEYYDYCYGSLEYRSLIFENEVIDKSNFQGCAVCNYTDHDTPWTRIIEHKHFEFGQQEKTVITREYSQEWHKGIEPYYPINDNSNTALYNRYQDLGKSDDKVNFGGRLGFYKYLDMNQVIDAALALVKLELGH